MCSPYIPGSMCLKVVLCNYIEAVFIAKLIEIISIRIMTGSYRIYVITLHGNNILFYLFFGNSPSVNRAEIVSVSAVKHNSLAIYKYNLIFYFYSSKAYSLVNYFCEFAAIIIHLKCNVIKFRLLSTPKLWLIYSKRKLQALAYFSLIS